MVVALDFTSLSVALPTVEHDFDADVSTVQWVINAYALVFGVLIVTGGRLADMFGRRRIFFIGIAIFMTFSALAAVAQSAIWLIGARGLMGIGGAMMWPAVLGLIYAILPEDRAGLAGGLVLGTAGIGNAAGPLIGGFLTDAASWRWILLINVPIGLFAVLVTLREVPADQADGKRERLDYAGIATLSLGLFSLLVALDQATDYGWGDWRIVSLLALAVVMLVSFMVIERRAGSHALVPRDVLSNRPFMSTCLSVLLMSATFFAALLYLPQFMQKMLNFSPLKAGAGLLPMMAVFAAVSFAAGPLYSRVGGKRILVLGAVALTAGMFLFSQTGRHSGWSDLVPGMVVMGIGIGLFYSTATTIGVTALDPARASLAGALVYMFQVAGGAVGLGLTTTVFTSGSQDSIAGDIAKTGAPLTAGQQHALQGLLAGADSAKHVLAHVSHSVADRITDIVRDAFVVGFQHAFTLDAALAGAGLVVAILFVGGAPGTLLRRGSSEGERPPAADSAS